MGTKASFFAELGPSVDQMHVVALRQAAGALPDDKLLRWPGWWFSAPGVRVDWEDLGKALATLRRCGIDPNGEDVARLGSEFRRMEWLATEKRSISELETLLRSRAYPSGTRAETLRKEYLQGLRPFLKEATMAKPDVEGRGGQTNGPLLQVLHLAERYRWPYQAVAAALLLSGAIISDWDKLRRRIAERDRWRRRH